MNKIFLFLIGATLLLGGCKKDYDKSIFDQSPQARTQELLKKYQSTLTAAPYGWTAYIFPASAGPVTFYFKFDSANRVVTYCDMSSTTAQKPIESSYRLQNLQTTTLIFDTYTYLHMLSDPDPNVAGGTAGSGLRSDFEYYLNSVTDDTIKMTGAKNGVRVVMMRATPAQADAFTTGKVSSLISTIFSYTAAPNSAFHFSLPDSTVVELDIVGRLATFKAMSDDGKTVIGLNVPFSFTDMGIHLPVAFTYHGKSIQDVYWDKANNVFYIMLDGKRINVYPGAATFPLYPSFGSVYTRMYVPETSLDGSSVVFNNIYQQIIANTKTNLSANWYDLNFVMNAANKSMSIIIRAKSVSNASVVYTSTYNYTTVYDGTKVKFSYVSADANGAAMQPYIQSLLNYINNDNFKMEYYQSPTLGMLGRMISLDHGDFYFSGVLSK